MNKLVERVIVVGGVVSIGWALFHVAVIPQLVYAMVADAGGESAAGVAALASFIFLCNAVITAFLLGIGVALIAGRKSVRPTLFGKMALAMLTAFWLVRLAAPYFLLPEGVTPLQSMGPLDAIFALMVALYLVPLLLRTKAVEGKA